MNTTNPLLQSLRIPGSTFRLPSQGVFYEDGELDSSVKNGEVEVFPLTALDEIVLSTPDKLLSGKSIKEVFARCVPQILKPGSLIAKDVDFLMVCLRIVSFGDKLNVEYTHTCEGALAHKYEISLDQKIREVKAIDPTSVVSEYTVMMPNGQVVKLKPLVYDDVVKLYQTTAMIKSDQLTEHEAEQLVIDTMVGIIKAVESTTDRVLIKEWVMSIPLGWKRELEKAATNVGEWGIDLSAVAVCKDCGEEIEIPIVANPVSFFM